MYQQPGGRGGFQCPGANLEYLQILIAPKDRGKTAFTTHFRTYAFTRMSFDLKNAQATYQPAIDTMLITVRRKVALVYLDDIIVFLSSFKDHTDQLHTVLGLLEAAGVTLVCLIPSSSSPKWTTLDM